MADSNSKTQKSVVLQKNNLKPVQNQRHLPIQNQPSQQNQLPALTSSEREVSALPAEYSDLLKAPAPAAFDFKKQLVPIGAILIFSLVLVFLLNLGKHQDGKNLRGVSGNLNDLSNGSYVSQSADYESEQTCVDHPDGTKSCTTKTKLKRSFR